MKLRILKLAKYLLLTFVATLLILIVVNLKDEDYLPVPDSVDAKKPTDKTTNAYYAIVGFNAAMSKDMHKMGYKIVDEFERYVVDKNDFEFGVEQVANADALRVKGDYNVLFQFEIDKNYFSYLSKNKQKILDFKQINHRLYQRYLELIKYKDFKEDSFYIPLWSGILTIHKLHLNLIGIEWLHGDKNKAAAMLSDVIGFNRMLLENSSLLINRMIATALFSISLNHYSELSSRCKSCMGLDQIIPAISSLSRNEICMRQSYYSELTYLKRNFIKEKLYDSESNNRKNIMQRLAGKYFFQPAATFNKATNVYNKLLQSCEIEIYEISLFLEKHQSEIDFHFPWYSYIYNPIGKYGLENVGLSSLSIYVDTMLNLEAKLRMLRLQRFIYAKKMKPDNIASYLNQQENSLKNPFTNNSLKYDKKNNVIFFGKDQTKSISVQLRQH